MPDTPDPRELLRTHITGLEAKADQLSGELAEVRAELKQYKTALAALSEKPSKRSVTRAMVHRELVTLLTDSPGRSAPREELEVSLKSRLKSSGHKLNGISRRLEEALQDEVFTAANGSVSLASPSA